MKYFAVLVTTPGWAVSEKLSQGILERKLAACVSRLPGLASRYWWKGKIESAREELLIVKTNRRKLPALTEWVRRNHPYEVCEVVALPVAAGNPAYLRWIDEALAKA